MAVRVLTVLAVVFLMGAAAKDDKEKNKLDGTWIMASGERDGEPAPEDFVKGFKLIIKGEKVTVHIGDQTEEGTFRLDNDKKPKHMTYVPANGTPNRNGIYELDGDKLKICMSRPDGDRPTEFSTKAGSNCMLFNLKREK